MSIRNRRLWIPALTLASTLSLHAGDVPAASPSQPSLINNGDFQASLTVGYESLHVYRGADSSLGGGNLWQGLDVEYKDTFHFNLYHGTGLGSKYEELTPSFYIHHDFGPVDIAAGVIFYHFPDYHSSDSQEYYLRFSHDFKNGLSTWLHAGYNQDADGYYEELGLRYTRVITDKLSIAPYAAIALSQHYRATGDSGLDQVTFGLNAPYQLTQKFSVTPAVGIGVPLDTFDGHNELWGALTLSYKF